MDGLCALLSGPCTPAPHVVVFSAFPGEQVALRAAAEVTERIVIGGRPVLLGRLGGQRVALSLSGIGLVNAAAAARALVAQLDVSAIVFSGVAGSSARIGDVIVPATWTDTATGRSFPVDPALLADAQTVAVSGLVLDRCTPVPPDPPGPEVCLAFVPGVVVGGSGESADPFGGGPARCTPGRGEVFGCDPLPLVTTHGEAIATDAVDMETAAVAEVAAAHGVPFLGVRGVSDGEGDPLGLPGFPAQFFAYYRLAADNAAAVVVRVLELQPGSGEMPARRDRPRAGVGAACGFERAAATECGGVSAARRVARLVSRGCALRTRAAESRPRAARLRRKAAARWRRAASLVERGDLPACCAAALAARLRGAAAVVSADSPN